MTVIAIIPVIVALVGLVVYLLSSNGKAAELGRIAFAVGLLVAVYMMASHVIRIG